MDSYESLNAASLAETIREEFKDADRPVTIRDIADLPGKGFIVASAVISLAIVAALVGFAQNIQAMLQ